MLLTILKKQLTIFILIFSYINIVCSGEILYPLHKQILHKKTIHIVGKLKKRKNLKVFLNGNIINISKASLIKIKTKDGIFYLFKVDIDLAKGDNIVSIMGKDFNKTILLKFENQTFENDIGYKHKTFFHMNENKFFCKNCHDFKDNEECITCHNYNNKSKYIHGPVATRQCFICHDKNNYLTIKQPLSVQCLKCHQEFSDAMYNSKFAHAPSVAGYCTVCHSPHFSSEKFFLVDNVKKICVKCHENKINGYHVVHKNIKGHIDIFCTKCHNPHYGEVKYLYKEKIAKKRMLCKRCHK